MNRKQRRSAKSHGNRLQKGRALFEETFRRALKAIDIELIDVASGEQGKKPVWVLTVRRDGATAVISSPSQPLPQMVEGVRAALDAAARSEQGPKANVITDAVRSRPQRAVTAEAPGNPTIPSVDTTPENIDELLGDGGELGNLMPGGRA